MSPLHDRSNLIWSFASIFIVAVALNYVWEVAQSPLFAGANQWENLWWHCFVASLGDGVILWIIYGIGWTVFKRADWFINPGVSGYGVMLTSGLIVAIAIEWVAVHRLQRWEYGSSMPVVPGVDIALVPILQMLILPPMIFYIAAIWIKRRKAHRSQSQ
jgi:hypothetical protein